MTKDTPFLLHLYAAQSAQTQRFLQTSGSQDYSCPESPAVGRPCPGTGPVLCTHLPGHKEQQRGLLFFGFVLGNDFLSYWLDQLFGCLRLSIVLRICDMGGDDKGQVVTRDNLRAGPAPRRAYQAQLGPVNRSKPTRRHADLVMESVTNLSRKLCCFHTNT